MPSKGPATHNRAKALVRAILCHAHETPGEVSENGKLVWSYSLERKDREHRYELWVKTSTAFLVQLTAQYAEADGARLSTEQVRFIIRDYLSDRFLGVLIKAPDQGKAYRYFGLQLSYSKIGRASCRERV